MALATINSCKILERQKLGRSLLSIFNNYNGPVGESVVRKAKGRRSKCLISNETIKVKVF